MQNNFFNPFTHGFFRCAAATPLVSLARPMQNASAQIVMLRQCHEKHVGVVVFPELSLSGYSLQDLFHQQSLLDECETALLSLLQASSSYSPLVITGLPLMLSGRLYNCAALLQGGKLLGLVPKTYLPNYAEFYEKRQFSSAKELQHQFIHICNQTVAIGSDLLFRCRENPDATIAVEICEDLWAPVTPSSWLAMAGATIVCNPSASSAIIGKPEYRQLMVRSTSARLLSAYVYSGAGQGESTTDLAWDGHALIGENGTILEESERFSSSGSIIISDIDVEKLQLERMRNSSFKDCAHEYSADIRKFRTLEFTCPAINKEVPLVRSIARFPFVPDAATLRLQRCQEVLNIQIQGLATRLQSSGIQKLVIGVSGGLDSTLALIVACKALDRLGLPRSNLIACTMPGYATSDSTRSSAHDLMKALGASAREIDIKPSCMQMFKDIGHPFAQGEKVYDITFENVQAGERTSHLFRLANANGALVVGTGDLSELALGWCTYGVGDHMSHYNPNASVPKTLVRYLINWFIDNNEFGDKAAKTLRAIVESQISPELVPGESHDTPAQMTEEAVGPYELQDFNLYYLLRYGFRPSKVAYLSWCAWAHGEKRYDFATIKKWLEVFIKRFFGQSQFKRSCVPDAPKVGSGGALSPRGDWRAPSDASAETWLDQLKNNTP
ncbi:MAG: NAD synthetase / Glutamine amidotransferase chain of NAD synthetase [Candidatus Rifleibacterium amylolyticum]|nr:MAG: NAD synthetase / Glutamine amidotransferase chain of NAD synthetase [Candidatus Rifleibacterium amylolyticum]